MASKVADRPKPMSKYVQLLDTLWQGKLPNLETHPTYWDEFFLIKVNVGHLNGSLSHMSREQFMKLQPVIAHLFDKCHKSLGDSKDIRVANALTTLCYLYKRVLCEPWSPHSAMNQFIFGSDSPDLQYEFVFKQVARLLGASQPLLLRQLTLELLMVLTCGSPSLDSNPLLDAAMKHELFGALVELLRTKPLYRHHGQHVLTILSVLLSYQQRGEVNPYLSQFHSLGSHMLLHNMSTVIAVKLSSLVRHWARHAVEQDAKPSMWSSITSLVSDMFSATDDSTPIIHVGGGGWAVLLLFHIVEAHAHAVTVLSHTEVEELPEEGEADVDVPTNLLSSLLAFTSFVLQDQAPINQIYGHICLIILQIATEDDHMNAFMHDSNVKVPVTLHKAAMRHRPACTKTFMSGPMATAVLDLAIEYLLSHLKRNLSVDTYMTCLNVIHRLVCYQQKHRVRIAYDWARLWAALVAVVRFVLQHKVLLSDFSTYDLLSRVVTIFNLFITYGDRFLPDPESYDNLYYELIRERAAFQELLDSAKKQVLHQGPCAAAASQLLSQVTNIKEIIAHFVPKVDAWSTAHKGVAMTPEAVLAIVKENYGTLTLKLLDSVDKYASYTQSPATSKQLLTICADIMHEHSQVHIKIDPIPTLEPST
eukprot:m.201829 g.201829  ORF g.201829 m.201829 type:complete len:647 (-) comp14972_c0_seq3:457-2397(-)